MMEPGDFNSDATSDFALVGFDGNIVAIYFCAFTSPVAGRDVLLRR